jgi:hypothetical protein
MILTHRCRPRNRQLAKAEDEANREAGGLGAARVGMGELTRAISAY